MKNKEEENKVEFHNVEAEQAILGTIILNNDYHRRVVDFLEPKHFYEPAHQEIYEQIILGITNHELQNQVTLKEFFSNNPFLKGLGGIMYLSTLLGSASGIIDIRDYARTVAELWQKRELTKLILDTQESLQSGKFESVKAKLENEIAGLAMKEAKKKTQHIAEMVDELVYDQQNGVAAKFVPTGYKILDKKLNGGLYAQQLVIVGARPSVGKTSICQDIILNASKLGKKCLFISLEVDKRNVTLKFLSNLASVAAWKIQKNMMKPIEYEAFIMAKNTLKGYGIYTNDSSNMKARDVENIIKNQLDRNPVDLVVVDYVQYMRFDDAKGRNEAWSIKENTTALKNMAKQYDVSMLALAQINRKAVEGANQEPTVNDFKGSGGIEEDADVAIILHRDRQSDEDKQKGYFSNYAKLIIAKNRHGQTGEVNFTFDGDFGRFTEVEEL